MPTVSRNESLLFYEDTGSGEPPLLFVHGVGLHGHFRKQIDHFAVRHRVIAPDLPGFGSSDAGEREYTVAAFAEDIAWLCERLALPAPVVVGHSLGGAVAFEVAAANPHLVSAVVLIDPIPIVPAPELRNQRAGLLEALRGPGCLDAVRGFAEARMFRPTDDPLARARIINDMVSAPPHVVAAALFSAFAWNGEGIAARVEAPVLLITAGDGIPADMARVREIVPKLEIGRVVGSGHFAHVMVPDQINAMIERFLETSLLPAPLLSSPPVPAV